MALTWWLVRPYLNLSPADWQRLWGELPFYSHPMAEAVLGVWPRWDAIHYLNLALRGYAGGGQEGDTVFYPMFVSLTRWMTRLLGGDFVVGSLVVSTLAAVAALAGLYQLTHRHFGQVSARWAVTALALYPTSFFLLAPFTESLFLAFTLWTLLAAEDQRWWQTGVLGALASLTRGPGIWTTPALAWLVWRQWHTASAAERRAVGWWGPRLLGVSAPLLGGLSFLAWRQWSGYAPIPAILFTHSGLEMIDPLRATVYALAQWWAVHDLPTTLDVLSAFLFIALTLALIRNPRWRRGEWVLYLLIHLTFLLSKHSFVASSWQSLARYVLTLFPGFILLGDVLAQARPVMRVVYLSASATGLMILSALYALWWFIG
jgi:hypothetical protein